MNAKNFLLNVKKIDFIKKAWEESQKGCMVGCLIPARTDTNLFHRYIWNKDRSEFYRWVKGIEFLDERVKFLINGKEQDSAPFPSMFVLFGPHKDM